MGETVRVKDGYARNFLLPRGKALRATEANKKKFEGQRAELEARNAHAEGGRRRQVGQARRPELRHHPPGRRDRPALRLGVGARHRRRRSPRSAKFAVHRNHVALLQPIKTLGLHKTAVHLHPEVEAHVTVNVARSPEQAERQAKGEDLTVRETTSMDDLGLEVGTGAGRSRPRREPRPRVTFRSRDRRAARRSGETGS